eukprot:3047613-Rhodomonas_salina.2
MSKLPKHDSIQETAFSAQFVPGMRLLVFEFGVVRILVDKICHSVSVLFAVPEVSNLCACSFAGPKVGEGLGGRRRRGGEGGEGKGKRGKKGRRGDREERGKGEEREEEREEERGESEVRGERGEKAKGWGRTVEREEREGKGQGTEREEKGERKVREERGKGGKRERERQQELRHCNEEGSLQCSSCSLLFPTRRDETTTWIGLRVQDYARTKWFCARARERDPDFKCRSVPRSQQRAP